MEAFLALALLFGVPMLGALFIAREARLYRERHNAELREHNVKENERWI